MSKNLVIVESPAKAKTIGKYLGPDYQVKACMGHLRDLPKSTLGVEIEKDFEPDYQPIRGKEEIIRELKKSDVVVLAEIYAARESNTIGISSADLAARIPGSVYCETLQDVTACLRSIIQPGDIVLTMGAGDIFRAGEALLAGTESEEKV